MWDPIDKVNDDIRLYREGRIDRRRATKAIGEYGFTELEADKILQLVDNDIHFELKESP